MLLTGAGLSNLQSNKEATVLYQIVNIVWYILAPVCQYTAQVSTSFPIIHAWDVMMFWNIISFCKALFHRTIKI